MARRITTKKIFPKLESMYNNILITLLINKILKNGKKELAQKIVYSCLEILFQKTNSDPIITLKNAIRMARPIIKLKKINIENEPLSLSQENLIFNESENIIQGLNAKKGLEIYIYYNTFKSINLAIGWIIESAKKRKGNISNSLAQEILESSQGIGLSIKKLNEHNKLVETGKKNVIKSGKNLEHKIKKYYNNYNNF
jgi:small subunit ribosomal protein S7